MLYAAKCYWPGVTERELRGAGDRLDTGSGPRYLGALLFEDEALVLCLFDAPSRAGVKRRSDGGGIPCERVMDAVWIAPPRVRDPTELDR